MRLNCVAAAVFLLPGAFAQKPPTPDAILVAGASPAVNRATDVVLNPRFLAVAPDGTLYLAARRNEMGVLVEHVWRVDTAGTLSAVPGPWEAATDAQTIILAIAADASGNLYISGRQLWKLTPKGAVTTIAGLGSQPPSGSGPVPANSVANVATSLAVDLQGNVFFISSWTVSLVSDPNVFFISNPPRVWKISPDGLLRPFAGTGTQGIPPPSAGPVPALKYGLLNPGSLAADGAGNVYINDASGVLRVTPDGMLSRIPGLLPIVTSLAVDGSGNLYGGLITTKSGGQVAHIAPDGSLEILAGTGAYGFSDGCIAAAPGLPQAIYATLYAPTNLAADSAGNLYFTESGLVRKVSRDGQIHTVAGGPGGSFGGDGGPAANAFLAGPTALALDSNGNLYFSDRNNNRVRRIDPGGIIQTVAGSGATAGQDPACIAAPNGYIAYRSLAVWRSIRTATCTSAIPATTAF